MVSDDRGPNRTDWTAWHDAYDQTDSRLSRRLAAVQGFLRRAIDRAPAGPIRLVSACAGQGRDVLGVLPEHARCPDVHAYLVESDPVVAGAARAGIEQAGLRQVEVIVGDAGRSGTYAGIVPADVLLLCGVFGNISAGDVARTILEARSLVAPGGQLLWTRGRRIGHDATPTIRRWFGAAGFEERDYEAPDDEAFLAGKSSYSVGWYQLVQPPVPYQDDTELFKFIR